MKTGWKVDETHSGIHFAVRHMIIAKVHGRFQRWSAQIAIDEADLTKSSVAVTIEAESIDTGNANRDAELRKPNFLDAEKFPTLTFRSTRIERAGESVYRVVGLLTIRNVTKEIEIDAELGGFITDPWGAHRTGFTAKTSVQRSDYGMVWNQALEAGGVAVSDRVDINVDIEAVAQAAKVA